MGALFNYAFLDSMTHTNEELPLPAETFVRGLVSVLWTGIGPQPSPGSSIGTIERKKGKGPRR
jgi:hypothetical protein